MPVEMIFDSDANLAFGRLITNEGVSEQLLGVRSLVIVFDEHRLNERIELFRPER